MDVRMHGHHRKRLSKKRRPTLLPASKVASNYTIVVLFALPFVYCVSNELGTTMYNIFVHNLAQFAFFVPDSVPKVQHSINMSPTVKAKFMP